MIRRLAAAYLILALLLAGATPVLGLEETTVALTLNGYGLELDSPALLRGGTVMVPVEQFLSALDGPAASSYPDGQSLSGKLLYRWNADGGQALTARWHDKTVTLVPGQGGAELRDGVLWAPLRPLAEGLGFTVEWTGKVELSYPKRRVAVDNLKDLFVAIAPDTEIVLKQGSYSFADLDPKELEGINNPYFYIDYDLFDTSAGDWGLGTVYQVVIRDVRDLRILADSARVSTPWAYADVWHFENCRRVTLEGGTAVHDVEPGYCMGNCVYLEECQDIELSSVVLDGSGINGLAAVDSRNLLLKNVQITHCTWGAVALSGCENVVIDASRIHGNTLEFSLLSVYESGGVQVRNCLIEDNSAQALGSFTSSWEVVFQSCTFSGNQFEAVCGFGEQASGGAVFLDCGFDPGAFQAFMEAQNLSGLISPGLAMTKENQDNVLQYFQAFNDTERAYIILLLQQIASDQMTPANEFCEKESGVYLNACQFCLYDMNSDGSPEFILKTGSFEADFRYTVYTIMDGELIECGGLSGSQASLYANGSGGLVRYAAHMGVYEITASTLEGTTLITHKAADGNLDFGEHEDYPELNEFGYGNYNQQLEFSGIPTLFLAPKG